MDYQTLKRLAGLTAADLSNPETWETNPELGGILNNKVIPMLTQGSKLFLQPSEIKTLARAGELGEEIYDALEYLRKELKKEEKLEALTGEYHGYKIFRQNGKFVIDGPYCKPLIDALNKSKAGWDSKEKVWRMAEKPLAVKRIIAALPEMLGVQADLDVENRKVEGNYPAGYRAEIRDSRIVIIGDYHDALHSRLTAAGAWIDRSTKRWNAKLSDAKAIRTVLENAGEIVRRSAEERAEQHQQRRNLTEVATDAPTAPAATSEPVPTPPETTADSAEATEVFRYGNVDRGFVPPPYEVRNGKHYEFRRIRWQGKEYDDGDGDWMVVAEYGEVTESPETRNAARIEQVEAIKHAPESETVNFRYGSTGDLIVPVWLTPIRDLLELTSRWWNGFDSAKTWDDPASYDDIPVRELCDRTIEALKRYYI